MGTDCPEKFDWKFLRWILWDGRVASQRNVYQDITKNMKGKTLVICNQRDLYECFDWLQLYMYKRQLHSASEDRQETAYEDPCFKTWDCRALKNSKNGEKR